MDSDVDDVKELSDPVSCAECGRPTWSASGVCATCRRPAPQPAAPPTVRNTLTQPEPRMPDLDADGNIAEDVHCRRCGYNLRGLSPTGVCPECQMLNTRSLFGDMLRFSDPNWVRRLDNGVRLLIGAIFASVGGGILGMFAIMFVVGVTGGAMPPMTAMGLYAGFMTLITFVWVAAVWMVTTPDPGRSETEPPISARSLARWCILASLAAVPISTLQQQGFAAAPGPGAAPAATVLDTLLLMAGTVLGLVALVGTAAGVVYLRSLALRIPADGLADQTKIAGWAYVIVSAIGQVVGMVSMVVFGGAPAAIGLTPMTLVVMMGGCFIALGSLVFGIWLIVLLFRYAGAFRTAREGAERFAAAAGG